MARLTWTRRTAMVACLFLATACSLGQDKTPAIAVDTIPVRLGTGLRVVGHDWRPGEQVVIGVGAPEAPLQQSETVSTALADAAGSFVALFSLPSDSRWAEAPDIWVVAHTRDFGKVAIASYSQQPVPAPTATLRLSAFPTPTAGPVAHVTGYVENVAASARIIKVRPIEGQAEIIALVQATEILRSGAPAELTDVQIGDLIEASGQPSPEVANTIIAYRIEVRAAAAPTPTATPTQPAHVWRAEYYSNTTFSGNPSLVRDDPVIDFQWLGGAPANGLPADTFAVRWTGGWPFEQGAYRFYAQVDDGVRAWLDEHLIIDQWHESVGALYSAEAHLSAGSHVIWVEYFDARGSAHARLWWEYRGPDAVLTYLDWRGEYYNNMTLSGEPFLVVNDRVLDFDWGAGVPATGMPSDSFSVRWTRSVNLEEGVYRFYARVDDGVRLWVDESQVIDRWREGAAETYAGEVLLAAGQHLLRVEYFEHATVAEIAVWWELLPQTPTPTGTPSATPTHLPVSPTETPSPSMWPLTTTPSATPQSPALTATPE